MRRSFGTTAGYDRSLSFMALVSVLCCICTYRGLSARTVGGSAVVKNDEEPVPAIVLTRFAGLFENLASFPSGLAGRHTLNQASTGDERGRRN